MAIERATTNPTWNERTLVTPEEFGDLHTSASEARSMNIPSACPWVHHSLGLLNLFIEFFKDKALKEASHPPKYRGRYVDDT